MEEPRETSEDRDGEAVAATPVRTPEENGDADSVARLACIIESVLFAHGAPLPLKRLVEILDGPSIREVQAALRYVHAEYAPGVRGIQLHEVAGGYQFRTARENAQWVRAVFREKPARLGRATLETLAVVAYKQPVTKAEIEAVRGVDVDGTLATLVARRLIRIAGRKESVGRPLLYSTTPEFLEVFQLRNLDELPSLKELGPAPESESYDSQPIHETAASEIAADETDAFGATDSAATGDEPANAAGASGTPAEDLESRRDRVTTPGGGDDPQWADPSERPGGEGTGDQGGSEEGPDHD